MVMVGSVVLVGLLAMAPNWAIVDIPYPEASGGSAVRATAEGQVVDALQEYARAHSVVLKKGDIQDLKIDGPKATARVVVGQRAEVLHLEHAPGGWRVVRAE
jgi:hypothetical protein